MARSCLPLQKYPSGNAGWAGRSCTCLNRIFVTCSCGDRAAKKLGYLQRKKIKKNKKQGIISKQDRAPLLLQGHIGQKCRGPLHVGFVAKTPWHEAPTYVRQSHHDRETQHRALGCPELSKGLTPGLGGFHHPLLTHSSHPTGPPASGEDPSPTFWEAARTRPGSYDQRDGDCRGVPGPLLLLPGFR